MTVPVVSGLRYVPEYLTAEEHDRVLMDVDRRSWHIPGPRRIQYYGHWFSHAGGLYRAEDLPAWALEVAERLVQDGFMPCLSDQVIVTEYSTGQGIPPHIDAPVFADVIVSVSLGSSCVMEFTHPGEPTHQILLEPRSALIIAGDARRAWQHSIPARETDFWNGEVVPRGRRVSLTFRKIAQPAMPSS